MINVVLLTNSLENLLNGWIEQLNIPPDVVSETSSLIIKSFEIFKELMGIAINWVQIQLSISTEFRTIFTVIVIALIVKVAITQMRTISKIILVLLIVGLYGSSIVVYLETLLGI